MSPPPKMNTPLKLLNSNSPHIAIDDMYACMYTVAQKTGLYKEYLNVATTFKVPVLLQTRSEQSDIGVPKAFLFSYKLLKIIRFFSPPFTH